VCCEDLVQRLGRAADAKIRFERGRFFPRVDEKLGALEADDEIEGLSCSADAKAMAGIETASVVLVVVCGDAVENELAGGIDNCGIPKDDRAKHFVTVEAFVMTRRFERLRTNREQRNLGGCGKRAVSGARKAVPIGMLGNR